MPTFLGLKNVRRAIWPGAARGEARDRELVARIQHQAAEWRSLDAAGLRKRAADLADEVQAGLSPTADEILAPAFALVVEATRRTLGLSLYDVQLHAGLAMARGRIAELMTGEGKTLAAALPAFLFALPRQGVPVATPNRCRAERDPALLKPMCEPLGFSAGLLASGASSDEKLLG